MKNFVASVAMAAALALPATAQDSAAPTAEAVLATVNGTDITLGHLIAMQAMLPQQYQDLPDNVLFDGLLEQLVQQEVLAGVAAEDITAQMMLGLDNERRAYLAATLIDGIALADLPEEEVQAEYEAIYGSADAATEYNAAHILVETETEAQSVIDALAEGADFAELAQERSIGPSGPNGGELGWFSAGMMVPTFEEAVFALSAGEVSPPVQTEFGWHVVLLRETRQQEAPGLEQVRAEIEDGLRRARVEEAIGNLTAAADVVRPEITIDPAVIRDLDLIAD